MGARRGSSSDNRWNARTVSYTHLEGEAGEGASDDGQQEECGERELADDLAPACGRNRDLPQAARARKRFRIQALWGECRQEIDASKAFLDEE